MERAEEYIRRCLSGIPKSEYRNRLQSELADHLALLVSDLEGVGYAPEEARTEALRQMGDAGALNEGYRAEWKRQPERRRYLVGYAIGAVLGLFLLLVVLWQGVSFVNAVTHRVKPAHDLDTLALAAFTSDRSVTVDADRFEYWCSAKGLPEQTDVQRAEVFAYDDQVGRYGEIKYLEYYAVLDETPCGSWVVSFYEDGSGGPNEQNLLDVYRKAGTESAPEWLEALKAKQEARLNAASDSDLD